MPTEKSGKLYLSQSEALVELEVAPATFQIMKRAYDLHSYSFPGRSRYRFYLKDAIDAIKNSSVSEAEEVKAKIQELQQ